MYEKRLNNGLKIVEYPIDNAQSIEIGLYIKAGARYENKGDNGITHLLEHMHFRQLGNMKQKEIYEYAEKMGSTLRGTTYKEMLCFNIKVRPKYLKKSLNLFEKIITTYEWTEEQLKSEKKVVISEIREKEDNNENQKIIDRVIWNKHPLSNSILGNASNIKRITLQKLVQYKKKIFCKDNMLLVITGAINEEEIIWINKKFEAIAINECLQKINSNNMNDGQFKRKHNYLMKNYPEWNLINMQLIFDVDLKQIKENELLFFNSIVGGGDGSYLQQEIRDKRGMVYDIYSYGEIFSDKAVWSIVYSIEKDQLYLSLNVIVKMLKMLKTVISQEDIEKNMPFFTENLWYWTEGTKELNFQLGNDFIKNKIGLTINERIKENEKINYERMQKVAEIILKNKNMSLIAMGPIKGR
ncbi:MULTISPECIES: pitrilysin family protein [unclassified Eubacterium (in: firmicutes)]|uniref:M16 family metallopeptidase n=1 Tax=unclassified Eubacterium (in: firmicutes) TaxID=2624479 RepID=UPI000E545DE9|nr:MULTISPECIES: pitrilysin family protein [unclassified Eubacterium (in: firmicutes)]MEE0294956.1 pitrilysin family protein [Eubacterium sp.]RGG61691.1 insulinase family protein [Eubacterium sp. AF17-7]RHR32278.1 insulinase family protein [Eubacterium sp. AF19-12LB]